MEKKLKRGIFITFEGPEGSGKSTHSRRLAEELMRDGYDIVHTAEPGGTGLGRRIREILLEKDSVNLGARAELLLFEADRAQHLEELISPALEEGKLVLCDRFNTATFAYQGYGLGMDMDLIGMVDGMATGGMSPDLTVLLDVDAVTGLARAGREGPADRMEKRSADFHERVREGYLDLAAKDPVRMKVVDARAGIEETYGAIKDLVYDLIKGRQGTE